MKFLLFFILFVNYSLAISLEGIVRDGNLTIKQVFKNGKEENISMQNGDIILLDYSIKKLCYIKGDGKIELSNSDFLDKTKNCIDLKESKNVNLFVKVLKEFYISVSNNLKPVKDYVYDGVSKSYMPNLYNYENVNVIKIDNKISPLIIYLNDKSINYLKGYNSFDLFIKNKSNKNIYKMKIKTKNNEYFIIPADKLKNASLIEIKDMEENYTILESKLTFKNFDSKKYNVNELLKFIKEDNKDGSYNFAIGGIIYDNQKNIDKTKLNEKSK